MLRVGLPVVAVPVVGIILVFVRAYAGADFEWAMRNDAVWNTITTRFMVEDGGLNAIAHPSGTLATPLTPGLLAIVAAVGRDGVASADLLATT